MNRVPVIIKKRRRKKKRNCLSCGIIISEGRRKYCTKECRQKLKRKLEAWVGLVQALNARYATFYFSDKMIMMDLLPYGMADIFTFFYPRTPGKQPADDFSAMANLLGDIWWAEKRKTNKRHLATIKVLSLAERNVNNLKDVKPSFISIYSINRKYLKQLQIDKRDLLSPELITIIKNAYRRLAKVYHPDVGGNADSFRKLQEAYEGMMMWSVNRRFHKRRGFPDKWLYDGEKRKWLQPLGEMGSGLEF